MKSTLAVTAFNETTRGGPSILKCIDAAVSHDMIDEIVIVDDHSEDFDDLVDLVKNVPKVQIFKNESNLGVFGNKLSAISHSSGDWIINSDSDNIFSKQAISLVLSRRLDSTVWYCPSFARPKFDYRAFVGSYDASSVGSLIRRGGLAHCFVNTGNQTVNRQEFMKVFERYLNQRADLMMPNYLGLGENDRKLPYWRNVFDACDSLIFNLEWIKNGGTLEIVKGFEYEHFWTGGQDSNYNRAPSEKGQLNEALLSILGEVSCR